MICNLAFSQAERERNERGLPKLQHAVGESKQISLRAVLNPVWCNPVSQADGLKGKMWHMMHCKFSTDDEHPKQLETGKAREIIMQ